METYKHTLYIVDNNKHVAGTLRRFLLNHFKENLNIKLYFSDKSCLRMMHEDVELVILDQNLNEKGDPSKQSVEFIKIIKERFPQTQVVIHTSSEEVAMAVESMRAGASEYIVKDNKSWFKLEHLVDRMVSQPLRLLVAEFGVAKFIAIFFGVFMLMGVGVVIALHLSKT